MVYVVFTETAAQYEARIAVLQSQPVEWRRASGQNMVSVQLSSVVSMYLQTSPLISPPHVHLVDQRQERQDGGRTLQQRFLDADEPQSDGGRDVAIPGQDAGPTSRPGGGGGGWRRPAHHRGVFLTTELRLGLAVLLLLGHALLAQETPRSGRHGLTSVHGNFGARSYLPAAGWTPAGHAQRLGLAQCSGIFFFYRTVTQRQNKCQVYIHEAIFTLQPVQF